MCLHTNQRIAHAYLQQFMMTIMIVTTTTVMPLTSVEAHSQQGKENIPWW